MKILSDILKHKITSTPQIKKTAREIRAIVRAVTSQYTVPVEFVMDMEEVLK